MWFFATPVLTECGFSLPPFWPPLTADRWTPFAHAAKLAANGPVRWQWPGATPADSGKRMVLRTVVFGRPRQHQGGSSTYVRFGGGMAGGDGSPGEWPEEVDWADLVSTAAAGDGLRVHGIVGLAV